ncbi:MAG: FAD-binding protein, partial [Jatrophihabitantaceae bacterium]
MTSQAQSPADNRFGRRSFLAAAAGTIAAAVPLVGAPAPAAAAPGTGDRPTPPAGHTITPADPRYAEMRTGNNQRFVARPEYIKLITSARDAVTALSAAAAAKKKVSLRSGGHCFADFVCNPEVEVILDMSTMTNVFYDPAMRAFAVEPGARLINVYEKLYKGWGVTIPGGICWSVGIGGHIAGGGYGLLSRGHGLVVDHLYAVEVVTLDRRARAKIVVAKKTDTGELGDLFWAHTGGGGGNFGIVTKYWFRSPGARGKEPSEQLMAAPSQVLVNSFGIPWEGLSETDFSRLVTNFSAWHEKYKHPGTPESNLSSLFNVSHQAHGSMGIFTQIDAAAPHARAVLDGYIEALNKGVNAAPQPLTRRTGDLPAMPELFATKVMSWMQATKLVGTNNPTITNPILRGAHKSAYLNERFSAKQLKVLYQQMTKADFTNPDTMLVLFSFGGQVNAVDRNATANAQRRSAFKMCLQTFWESAKDDEFFLQWERETFEGMFAETGGVPVPGGAADGCYINYPDADMADPKHNTSGVSWQSLYYQDNYPRLQRAKKTWDPLNYFTHRLG